MAAPTSTLVADWTVETGGGHPALPAPQPTDPNLVRLKSEQTNAAPVLTPDGSTKG